MEDMLDFSLLADKGKFEMVTTMQDYSSNIPISRDLYLQMVKELT